jgi:SMC interacting uncharacterized protein involved in chromosome segregation
LVIVKGQLNKVQRENQNLSNKLKKEKQIATKVENLRQEYVELNQLNEKTHNYFNNFQVDLEWMIQNYSKMKESILEQHGTIIGLEQTCQHLKEQ